MPIHPVRLPLSYVDKASVRARTHARTHTRTHTHTHTHTQRQRRGRDWADYWSGLLKWLSIIYTWLCPSSAGRGGPLPESSTVFYPLLFLFMLLLVLYNVISTTKSWSVNIWSGLWNSTAFSALLAVLTKPNKGVAQFHDACTTLQRCLIPISFQATPHLVPWPTSLSNRQHLRAPNTCVTELRGQYRV